MGMPMTVGELCDFLLHACEDRQAASGEADPLDWSLAQWRAHRLNLRGDKGAEEPEELDSQPTCGQQIEELALGRVLVHRVPFAPARPILCIDDPEASLMKAADLLLTYPELDALAIVSPIRGTVVAHLTLSYCLAYAVGTMRGETLAPLAELQVRAADPDLSGAFRRFRSADSE